MTACSIIRTTSSAGRSRMRKWSYAFGWSSGAGKGGALVCCILRFLRDGRGVAVGSTGSVAFAMLVRTVGQISLAVISGKSCNDAREKKAREGAASTWEPRNFTSLHFTLSPSPSAYHTITYHADSSLVWPRVCQQIRKSTLEDWNASATWPPTHTSIEDLPILLAS